MSEPGAGQGGTGQVRTGHVGTGQVRTGHVGTGQVCTSRFRTVQVWTGQVKTSQAGQVSTGENGQVLLGTGVWPYSVLLVLDVQTWSFTTQVMYFEISNHSFLDIIDIGRLPYLNFFSNFLYCNSSNPCYINSLLPNFDSLKKAILNSDVKHLFLYLIV